MTADQTTIDGYKAQLRTDVANALNVSADGVDVVSLAPGATVAKVTVTDAPSGAAATLQTATSDRNSYPLLSQNTGVQEEDDDSSISAAGRAASSPFAVLAALVAAVALAAMRA